MAKEVRKRAPGGGRKKNPPAPKKMLKDIVPINDLFSEDELVIYNSLVDIYLKDFEDDDLTASDMDDIMTLSTNKILEVRLLKASKDDTDRQIDTSAAIEKLRKQTEKIKENLSARRRDRVDPNDYKGFSIVDLAVAFDQEKRAKMEAKARKLRQEQKDVLKELKKHPGNRYDIDGDTKPDE